MCVIAHLVFKTIYFKSLCGNRSDRCATIVQTIVRLKRFPDHVFWVAPRHRYATQMIWSERSKVAHLNLGTNAQNIRTWVKRNC